MYGLQFVQLSMDNRYLHAGDDGTSVFLDARSRSNNAVWAVQLYESTDNQGVVKLHKLLRGPYGRYLGSTSVSCAGVNAVQLDRDKLKMDAIMWQVVRFPGPGEPEFVLRAASGPFLSNISMAGGSSCYWKVESLNSLERPQQTVNEKPKLLQLLHYLQWSFSDREIRWVLANANGTVNEKYWGKFIFTGRYVSELAEELSHLVELPTTLCIRAGRHGQPTPLRVDLPRSKEPIHIVLLLDGTQGSGELRFPDLNHRSVVVNWY
ncbi:hypothetical protein ACUV84_025317 [Puccinellia chinampoensis]